MIDFTDLPQTKKAYAGANGKKICVIYNNAHYMLKFPPAPSLNQEISYTNSCISEYLGCHILENLGFQVQETLMGTYRVKDSLKLVVACKDFATNGFVIQDFASLKNQIIDSTSQGKGTELDSILETIEKQTIMDSNLLMKFFWETFIADAFIGNWDRHNGNWGFLYDPFHDSISLAPLWDCGSCLYPQADDNIMQMVLNDKNELNNRIYTRPTSAITINGKRINYFDFISSNQNHECTKALDNVSKRIDLVKINKIIDDLDCISDLQKQFYKTMLKERKERILDRAILLTIKEHSDEEKSDLEYEMDL